MGGGYTAGIPAGPGPGTGDQIFIIVSTSNKANIQKEILWPSQP